MTNLIEGIVFRLPFLKEVEKLIITRLKIRFTLLRRGKMEWILNF